MVKIIYSDNIPSDTSNEYTRMQYIPDSARDVAQQLCNAMNENLGDNQGPFYRVVDQNYKLYKWGP